MAMSLCICMRMLRNSLPRVLKHNQFTEDLSNIRPANEFMRMPICSMQVFPDAALKTSCVAKISWFQAPRQHQSCLYATDVRDAAGEEGSRS